MGKWMVSLVNSHTNATSKRWHLWEIDLRFALNSAPGWWVAHPGMVRTTLFSIPMPAAGCAPDQVREGLVFKAHRLVSAARGSHPAPRVWLSKREYLY